LKVPKLFVLLTFVQSFKFITPTLFVFASNEQGNYLVLTSIQKLERHLTPPEHLNQPIPRMRVRLERVDISEGIARNKQKDDGASETRVYHLYLCRGRGGSDFQKNFETPFSRVPQFDIATSSLSCNLAANALSVPRLR